MVVATRPKEGATGAKASAEAQHIAGQRKTIAGKLAGVEWKAPGDGVPDGAFTATFATLNVVDRDRDVTVPGAFQDGQEVRITQWGHNWSDLPVGRGVIHADDSRAWVDGQFFLDTTAGLETYKTVKNLGDLQEWSYGFDITEWSVGEFQGDQVRFLRGLDVFEVSPVLLGAGIGTGTDAIKAAARAADAAALVVGEATGAKVGRRNSAADLESMQAAHEHLAEATRLLRSIMDAPADDEGDDGGKSSKASGESPKDESGGVGSPLAVRVALELMSGA